MTSKSLIVCEVSMLIFDCISMKHVAFKHQLYAMFTFSNFSPILELLKYILTDFYQEITSKGSTYFITYEKFQRSQMH